MFYFHDIRYAAPWKELERLCDASLPGLGLYGGRALCVTGPEDTIVIPRGTASEYRWVREHYNEVGLLVADRVLEDGSETLFFLKGEESYSVFFFGDQVHEVRPNYLRHPTTRHLNDKNYFLHYLCAHVEVPYPKTWVSRVGLAVEVPRQFPVYVKLAVSATGLGIWRCESFEEWRTVTQRLGTHGYQVQEALPLGTRFYNVQYELDQQQGLLVEVTEQILDGNQHVGNRSSVSLAVRKRLQALANPLAHWAVEQGLQEVWAYDFAQTPDDELLVLECNPRWNGSSYPIKVARRLGITEWEMRNVSTKRSSLQGLNLTDIAYRPERGSGVIVVNWATVWMGKLGIFVAGSPTERAELLERLCQRLR